MGSRVTRTASVLGVEIAAVERDEAADLIIKAAVDRHPLGASALAVHGVMEGVADPRLRFRLNDLELVVADGQPVRWALNWLHGIELDDRVCGPVLMADVCAAAEDRQLPIFLFGSTEDTLSRLEVGLRTRWPNIVIAGSQPSRFRPATESERAEDIRTIRESGAAIVLVGLGCPRQEVFAWETRTELSMPVLAVGAAFDFHAGGLRRAPEWMQRRGLEWFYRLAQEPRRLWRRYLILNPAYLFGITRQRLGFFQARPPIQPEHHLRPS